MLFARFLKDRRGNIAPIFALAVIPMIGLIGAAVDYSRANSVRTAMQAALDSTALAMSKTAANLTNAQLQTQAQAYFSALFNRPEAKGVAVTATYTSAQGGSTLTMSGSGSIDTTFAKALGLSKLDFNTTSTVTWGMTKLRVALALDNTGSMADAGKMTALKTATKSLLTTLKNAAAKNGDIYVSIIPFAQEVNVGASNWNANWVDFTEWDNDNRTCTSWSWFSCQSYSTPSHKTWNGCIMDRDQDYDVKNTTPSPANGSTLFPAKQSDYCPAQLLPQTYDWSALSDKVDDMTPNGATNQTIGLAWAWQSLTDGKPLSPPALDANVTTQKIIILLSDGLNTRNRWDGNGSSVSTAVDARMNKVCTNAKAAGITIYTVHVNTDGDPTSTVLQNCASSSDKFFVLTTAGAIVTTFNQIGTALAQLRITK